MMDSTRPGHISGVIFIMAGFAILIRKHAATGILLVGILYLLAGVSSKNAAP